MTLLAAVGFFFFFLGLLLRVELTSRKQEASRSGPVISLTDFHREVPHSGKEARDRATPFKGEFYLKDPRPLC